MAGVDPIPPDQIPGPQGADAPQEGGGVDKATQLISAVDGGFSALIQLFSASGVPEQAVAELSDIRSRFQGVLDQLSGDAEAPAQGGARQVPNAGGGVPAGPQGV